MKKYKDFRNYIEENFLDVIKKKLDPFIFSHKDSFENNTFYEITFVTPYDYVVCGVTFKERDDGLLEIRTSVDAEVEIKGKTRYGYESNSSVKTYNVFFKARLENGLHDVTPIEVQEYDKNKFERDKSLSQNLVPYMYEEDVEKHAEEFLKKHCPKALLQPMCIPVNEIVENMGMKMYYAPLEDNIFGKTYFGEEIVEVYRDITRKETVKINTAPGTMLINPNVYFMYNIGTANNTIIHECVHWDRHRRPFELHKLLEGECNHISCETVEGQYNGIDAEASALKWMEWQANQLAPRILMPAEMTKTKLQDFLQIRYQNNPKERYAVHLEGAICDLASFFRVSIIAAKIRAIDIGYDRAQGVQVYCEGRTLPPFSFPKGTLQQNQTFVIDEKSAMIQVYKNPTLRNMFLEGRLIYANGMVCINAPKYVVRNELGQPILTDFALEHVNECCYVFKRKINASDSYNDSFYRRCFLCKDVSSDTYIEADYDPEHEDNQDKDKRRAEIEKITESIRDIVTRLSNEIPGGFGATLSYHMKRKKITNEELSARTNISTVSISNYRNSLSPNISIESTIALCNGLKLERHYSHDLIKKAGYDLSTPTVKCFMIGWVIDEHSDDTLQQWQDKFTEANVNIKLPGCY